MSTPTAPSSVHPVEAARHGLSDRLVRALGAGLVNQGLGTVIQLISVPLFLANWGAERYGEWLVLSAVPTYLGMSDIGFATAAGNDMTMRVARGDRPGALRIFQSVWILTTVLSTLVALGAALLAWKLPLDLLGLGAVDGAEARVALGLLAVHIVVGLQSSVMSAAFRCNGRYATGLMLGNVQRTLEFVALMAAVLVSRSLVAAAAAYLTGRVVGVALTWLWLRQVTPWLRFGRSEARWSSIRELAWPAATFLAFPLGNALGNQGMVSVVGALLGPRMVPILTTHRTIANVVQSLLSLLNFSIWPEMSAAYGAQNLALARALHRRTAQAALWLAGGACLALALAGRPLLTAWTRGVVAYDPGLFLAVMVAAVTRTLWSTSLMVSAAINRHGPIASWYLGISLLTISAAALALRWIGLAAVGVALAVGDLVMWWVVLHRAVALLEDRVGEVLRTMLRPPALRGLVASLRRRDHD